MVFYKGIVNGKVVDCDDKLSSLHCNMFAKYPQGYTVEKDDDGFQFCSGVCPNVVQDCDHCDVKKNFGY